MVDNLKRWYNKTMRTPHSSTNKGKRVKITMRNGDVIIGKFKDKKSGKIFLEPGYIRGKEGEERTSTWARSWISMNCVRAFSIYKPTT